MESPNPNATDMATAKKLVELSYGIVGLEGGVGVDEATPVEGHDGAFAGSVG